MKELLKALDEFHKKTPLVKAEKENPFFKSKYADYNTVVSATREDLKSCGLTVKQALSHIDQTPAIHTLLIHAESGEKIESLTPVVHKPNDPQALGSGITYVKRYAYVAILDLLVDTDDDGALSEKLSDKDSKVKQAIQSLKKAKTADELKRAYIATGVLMNDSRVKAIKDERKEELGIE